MAKRGKADREIVGLQTVKIQDLTPGLVNGVDVQMPGAIQLFRNPVEQFYSKDRKEKKRESNKPDE